MTAPCSSTNWGSLPEQKQTRRIHQAYRKLSGPGKSGGHENLADAFT
jgi:hypothetical protein